MPRKFHGLDWLDTSDLAQLQWAQEYLAKHGVECNFPASLAPLKLRELGQKLESDAYGRELLGKMQGAWRKNTSRNADDRKTYSFRLLPITKKELDSLAKKNKKNSTDFLIQLITDSSSLYIKLKEGLKKANNKLQLERADLKKETDQYKKIKELTFQLLEASIADCCKMEILLRDAAITIGSATDKQMLEAEEIAKTKIAEANTTIDRKHRILSGFHSIKSPMDHPNAPPSYIKRNTPKTQILAKQSEHLAALRAQLETERARNEELARAAVTAQKRADDLARELDLYKKTLQKGSENPSAQRELPEKSPQAVGKASEDIRDKIIRYVLTAEPRLGEESAETPAEQDNKKASP